MRALAVHVSTTLFLAGLCLTAGGLLSPAQAHPLAQPSSIETQGLYDEPGFDEVEQALADAAWEFDVPHELLAVIAHTESRWRHRPARTSAQGRSGLLQLKQERIEFAAELLDLPSTQVRGDVISHCRGFAALLDLERPNASSSDPGAWRDAVAWAMDFSPDAAVAIIDRWLAMLDEGIIDRLEDGTPISIPPVAIDPNYLGLFAAIAPNSCRSIDYPGAAQSLTPCNYSNASRTVGDVDRVIIHTIEGSANGAISWFWNCNAQVSAHYVVSEAGEVTQVVDERDIGWHVSCWNSFSIGIEHEGYASDPTHPDTLYQASAALVTDILNDWNLPPDRQHIVGHVEIDSNCNPNGHWDPGPGWDWDYYMSLIGGENTIDLTELVGYIRHTDLYDSSAGIAGATVTIDGHGTAQADSDGYYVFDEIPPGTWTVCANANGYDSNCRTKTVEADLTNWASILLEPSLGDDEDDDTRGDDDDDTSSDDDDDTSSDDDDSTPEPASDNPDPGFDSEDDDSSRGRDRSGCACSSNPHSKSPGWLATILLMSLIARRRRSDASLQS